MRRFAIVAIAVVGLAAPVGAQDSPADEEEGLSLMERGARLFMEGMMKEVEPAIDGLGELAPKFRSFAREMGPALRDLMGEVEDWSVYHPPEFMPNGDIIIRRKETAPDMDPPQENDEIDI